jgi:hypothetical protein
MMARLLLARTVYRARPHLATLVPSHALSVFCPMAYLLHASLCFQPRRAKKAWSLRHSISGQYDEYFSVVLWPLVVHRRPFVLPLWLRLHATTATMMNTRPSWCVMGCSFRFGDLSVVICWACHSCVCNAVQRELCVGSQ